MLPIWAEEDQLQETEETLPPAHQPRLIVTTALAEPSLKAGGTVKWSVTVKNCSVSESVVNMKVTLTVDGNDISPERTSWYFEKVGAGKSIDLSQNVTVLKKALDEMAQLQFEFEYDDEQGNSYTCTEPVHLPIAQEQQAEIANLSFPETVYSSDTESFTFQVCNTGLAMLYNVRVSLMGTGLFPTRDLFMGNMEAGESKDGEIPIFVGTLDMDEKGEVSAEGEKYGETSVKLVFSYENEQGEVREQTMKIPTQICQPNQVQLKIEKEVPKTNQWWVSIIVLTALALIFIIVCLFLRLKHFKKRVELYEKA